MNKDAKEAKIFGSFQFGTRYNYRDKETNVTNYVRYMMDRVCSMFRYVGLPDSIPAKELELQLMGNGHVTFLKINGDLYALTGSLGGVGDAYNNPTQVVITNAYLNYSKTHKIHDDCVVMKNDTMYQGILPILEKYSTMLNECDITIIIATINKRVQMLLSANDDNTMQSAKRFLSDIEAGKLGVIAETKLFDSLHVNQSQAGDRSAVTQLTELQQYIKGSMYNELGLNAVFNMKREVINTSEIETNADMLYPLIDDMLMCRRQALEEVNAMFGTNIQVEFNSSWDYRFQSGEPINTLQENPDMTGDDSTPIDGTQDTPEGQDGDGNIIPLPNGETPPEGPEMGGGTNEDDTGKDGPEVPDRSTVDVGDTPEGKADDKGISEHDEEPEQVPGPDTEQGPEDKPADGEPEPEPGDKEPADGEPEPEPGRDEPADGEPLDDEPGDTADDEERKEKK